MPQSDHRQSQAQRALQQCSLHDLRDLTVEKAGEQLVISGRVESFYHKQMAQEIVRAVCEGIELKNVVDVQESDSHS